MYNEPIADTSIDTFIEEQKVPTTMSTGSTTAEQPEYPINNEAAAPALPPAPPKYVSPTAKPIFTEMEDMPEVVPAPTPEAPKRSEAYKEKVLYGLINAEDYCTAQLLSMISGEDSDRYKISQEDKDQLVILMEPFKDVIVEKCPAWVPFIIVYGSVKTKMVALALKDKAISQSNKDLRNKPATAAAIAKDAAKPKERTYWKLYTDGYYKELPSGGYIKRNEANRHLLEKPDMKDLDKLLEANDLVTIQNAFGITEAELKQMIQRNAA
ncbi:MAG: hypothetical protein EBX41_00775 [Chitinophagia bacterium]|nr:hypothetical protein [Chitinophagia bacterium]